MRARRAVLTVALAAAVTGLVPVTSQAATTHQVFMSNIRFCNTPACAVNEDTHIARGDTIEWVYADGPCTALAAIGCFHTSSATGWNSGAMPGSPTSPKLTFRKTFTSGGTFFYVCSIHANQMSARIVVS